jgi:L-glyceraldehyde 3-phosphate reductase
MTQRPGPYQEFVSDETFGTLDRLAGVAAGRGTSMAALALAWLLADPRVSQIVIGPARPDHLGVLTEALAHPLTPAEANEVS